MSTVVTQADFCAATVTQADFSNATSTVSADFRRAWISAEKLPGLERNNNSGQVAQFQPQLNQHHQQQVRSDRKFFHLGGPPGVSRCLPRFVGQLSKIFSHSVSAILIQSISNIIAGIYNIISINSYNIHYNNNHSPTIYRSWWWSGVASTFKSGKHLIKTANFKIKASYRHPALPKVAEKIDDEEKSRRLPLNGHSLAFYSP